MSASNNEELVRSALEMALARRSPPKSCCCTPIRVALILQAAT